MSEKKKFLCLFFLILFSIEYSHAQGITRDYQYLQGAIIRGNTREKELALVFTGDEYADGGEHIIRVLEKKGIKCSFFLTGRFYRNPDFAPIILRLAEDGHYLGAHSDQHLLYCDWTHRDSLLVTRKEFEEDLRNNYRAMAQFGIQKIHAPFFLPPYEWYNDSISAWTSEMGFHLVNYTAGTLSHADYTIPGTPQYRSSREIYDSILQYESDDPQGLRGFILLSHIGTHKDRTDKFYMQLESLIHSLQLKGYRFLRMDELLQAAP